MEINCARCGEAVKPRQVGQRFCSKECRQKAQRSRSRGEPESGIVSSATVVQLHAGGGVASVVASTRAALSEAGRGDTYLGQAALAAAERLDGARAVNGYAAVLKEYRDTMREAMADVEQHADTADELRAAALRVIGGA